MPFGLFKGIAADVKLSDEEYVKNEKERFVPFSVNPFRVPKAVKGQQVDSDSEEEGEPVPEWLELAGDLAWTSTFSSLTSNTTVTEPISVWNYAVFFGLTWHLWATQTTYDIKYYTNDWWHRALFASQLGVYAILAAFSGSFSVGWEISSDTMDIFTGNATALTAEAIKTNEENSMLKSFRGVNVMLFISRMLLLVQYLRVLWYRRKSHQMWSWRFFITPFSTLLAGFIFLGCYVIMKDSPNSKGAAITQLTLWGLAIGIQVLAAAVTPEDGDGVLKNNGQLSPRLSTLTVIILGEGLNGICGTLRHSINSLGLTPTMIGEAVSVLLVLYFIWLLYFDGFRIKFSSSRVLDELWLWSHFPLHLSLIMLLEGIKNLFLYVNVINALNVLGPAFDEAFDSNTNDFPEHPRLEKLLLPLKLSWSQELKDLEDLVAKYPDDENAAEIATGAQFLRWQATIIHNVYLLFNDEPDPEAEHNFNSYLANNDTVIVNDALDDGPLLSKSYERYVELMQYTTHWLLAVSGSLLICMAILNIMQRRPKNRFAWGYSLNRTALGCILILIGAATSKAMNNLDWMQWIIPTAAICYCVATVIDWVILYFSIHSIRRKEERFPNRSGSDYDGDEKDRRNTGRGVNLRQLSELSYDQTPSSQRETAGSAAGKTYPPEEAFDPYAEAGVPYYPRKQGSTESSSDPTRQSLLGRNQEGY